MRCACASAARTRSSASRPRRARSSSARSIRWRRRRPPLAVLDAPASGRMAVGEAITNLLAAPIALDRVKLSCNWMAACSDDPDEPGDDAALYDTVRAVAMELCPVLGIGVPVGKDSL